jgi:hypothetical protein
MPFAQNSIYHDPVPCGIRFKVNYIGKPFDKNPAQTRIDRSITDNRIGNRIYCFDHFAFEITTKARLLSSYHENVDSISDFAEGRMTILAPMLNLSWQQRRRFD